MDRRLVSVCTTVILSFLTLAHSSAANTPRKSILNKRPAALSTSRASIGIRSRDTKTPGVRATKNCDPCAAELAQKSKGHAAKKGAKAAKSLPCHPKDYIDPKIASNYKAALRDMKRAGIKPHITSVWRSSESQAELHRCSLSTRCRRANPGLYRALPAGKSIHEAGFAVDMAGIAAGPRGDKRLTPQGKRIVAIMKKRAGSHHTNSDNLPGKAREEQGSQESGGQSRGRPRSGSRQNASGGRGEIDKDTPPPGESKSVSQY